MVIDFARSGRSSLGLEWELALVDRDSGDLVPLAPAILERVHAAGRSTSGHATGEFLTNTIEIVSGVHSRVADGLADLAGTIETVRDAAREFDTELLSAGMHPFADWGSQQVTPKERYDVLIDRTQWWGRQLLIWGVHVHVGIDRVEKVWPIVNQLLVYLPHLQALSASSPFAFGEPTGYASSRAMLFQQLPTAGLPPQFDSWQEFESMVDDLVRVGQIDHWNELRWDIRPSPGWGTIEVRVCDGLPTLREVGAIAALVQCIVDDCSARLDAGLPLARMQPWYVRENKWRAARYGTDAIIILNHAGDERLVTEELPELVHRLTPVAERLGCTEALQDVLRVLDAGASYQRQLAAAAAAGGALRPVVDLLVREFAAGEPLPG